VLSAAVSRTFGGGGIVSLDNREDHHSAIDTTSTLRPDGLKQGTKTAD